MMCAVVRMIARVLLVVLPLGAASASAAGPEAQTTSSIAVPLQRRHVVYVELLGKGGLYGVGYDALLRRWLGVGASLSYLRLDGQNLVTASPYLNFYPIWRGRHALLLQAGLQIVHVSAPAVEGWHGSSTTDLGGQVSLGYEYRSPLLVRVAFVSSLGRNGWSPWGGVSLGWTF